MALFTWFKPLSLRFWHHYNSFVGIFAGMPCTLPAWLLPPSAQAPKAQRPRHDRAAVPSHKKAKLSPSKDAGHAPPSTLAQQGKAHQTHTRSVFAPPSPQNDGVARTNLSAVTVAGPSVRQKSTVLHDQHLPGVKRKHILASSPVRWLSVQVQRPPERPRKRVQIFGNVNASQRCGHCKTCQNRSLKKACLTRRAEMLSAQADA